MPKFKAYLNKTLWRTLFAGPLRIKVVIEREDGTELYHLYPLGAATVEYGQTVRLIDFEVGISIEEG